MPAKFEHQITSALTSLLFEIGRQIYLETKGVKLNSAESILSLIMAPLAGAAGGVIPDKLEPATSPDHREFYHSLAGGSAIGIGLSKIPINTENINLNLFNVCLRSSGIGYVTHLVQDAGTPKSIPIV